MIRAVVFDFFGVVGLSTYAMLAEKYHYTPEQHEKLWDIHRALDAGYIDFDEFIAAYAETLGIEQAEFLKSYREVEGHMGISQPVLQFADELRARYKVGLLTNVSSQSVHFVEPIESHFDAVVKSYEVRMAKPDVAIYELMARKLGVDVSECVMIDDSRLNCSGAEAAGMQAVLYQNIAQLRSDLANVL